MTAIRLAAKIHGMLASGQSFRYVSRRQVVFTGSVVNKKSYPGVLITLTKSERGEAPQTVYCPREFEYRRPELAVVSKLLAAEMFVSRPELPA